MDPKEKDMKQSMSFGRDADDLFDDDFDYEDWDDVIPDQVPRKDGPGGGGSY